MTHYLNVLISSVIPLGRVEFVFTCWLNLISVDEIIIFFMFNVLILLCVMIGLLNVHVHPSFVVFMTKLTPVCPPLSVVNDVLQWSSGARGVSYLLAQAPAVT
jgi:hypothetical protein